MMTRCIVFLLLAVLCQPLLVFADVVSLRNGQTAEDAYVLSYSRSNGEFECAIGNQTLNAVHAGEIASITFSHQIGDLLIDGRSANVSLTDGNSYPHLKLKRLETINGQMMFIGSRLDVPGGQDMQILANNVLSIELKAPKDLDTGSLMRVERAVAPPNLAAQQPATAATPANSASANGDDWDISFSGPGSPSSISTSAADDGEGDWGESDEEYTSSAEEYESAREAQITELANKLTKIGIAGIALTMGVTFLIGGLIINFAGPSVGAQDMGFGKAYLLAGLLATIPPIIFMVIFVYVRFLCCMQVILGFTVSGFAAKFMIQSTIGVTGKSAMSIIIPFYIVWVIVFIVALFAVGLS